MLKKFSIILLSVICLFACISCGSTEKPAKDETPSTYPLDEGPSTTKMVSPTADNVKLVGRTYEYGDVLWLGYSSTGVIFDVDAKTLEIDVLAKGNVPAEDSRARIVVFVKGQRIIDKMVEDSFETITVFSCKEAVKGEVRVLKVTESAQAWAGISSINVDEEGSVTPAAAKDLKIEFVGDSITCGYGIDDSDRNNHFSSKTEDNTKTYAYKTAEALNADYSMVSVSGSGIISGYTGDGNKNENALVPNFYNSLGFSWGLSTFDGNKPQDIAWDFSNFRPNVVVVNLGTNDNSYTKGNPTKCKEYEDAYVAFLKNIRSKNPDAYVVCTLGLMGKELLPNVKNAAERMNDSKITWVELNSTAAYGYGADWHPTEAGNEKAAEILTAKIKEIMNIK